MSFNAVNGSTVINQGTGGSAMNGTLTGTATIVSGGINGGNALSIPSGSASAAYVLITNPVVAFSGTASWTIGYWVKTTTAGATFAYQGSGGWASGNTTFYLNNGSGAGTHAGCVSYSQGWEQGSTNINDGNWHFLVMTCNGSAKAMYVDGKVDTIQSSMASGSGVGTQLWIGGSGDSNDGDVGAGGLIDGVVLYSNALSQAQIQTLYTNIVYTNSLTWTNGVMGGAFISPDTGFNCGSNSILQPRTLTLSTWAYSYGAQSNYTSLAILPWSNDAGPTYSSYVIYLNPGNGGYFFSMVLVGIFWRIFNERCKQCLSV